MATQTVISVRSHNVNQMESGDKEHNITSATPSIDFGSAKSFRIRFIWNGTVELRLLSVSEWVSSRWLLIEFAGVRNIRIAVVGTLNLGILNVPHRREVVMVYYFL